MRWLTSAVAATLLLGTGCSLLDPLETATSEAVHTVDPNVPFVVVTVGGSPVPTTTPGVAETIPDSTPLPRIELPGRDPAATARPVASPSLNRAATSASQRARPAAAPPPSGSPAPANQAP